MFKAHLVQRENLEKGYGWFSLCILRAFEIISCFVLFCFYSVLAGMPFAQTCSWHCQGRPGADGGRGMPGEPGAKVRSSHVHIV